jgi:hypothetical protein
MVTWAPSLDWRRSPMWSLPHAIGAATPPWYLLLGLPVAGAGIVIAARMLLPGDGGHDPLPG